MKSLPYITGYIIAGNKIAKISDKHSHGFFITQTMTPSLVIKYEWLKRNRPKNQASVDFSRFWTWLFFQPFV